MGCCESLVFDPPVRRCCNIGNNCCVRRCDTMVGIPERDVTPTYQEIAEADGANCRIHSLSTEAGVPFHVWCYEPRVKDQKVMVDMLYSHGRHEDITFIAIRRFLKFIAVHAGANVYLYEYPGFAHSGGSPTSASAIEAGVATFDYLVKLNQNFVLSMGHSMGCAIALEVATRRIHSGYLIGSVLRSPFTSVCAVKICPCPSWLCCCCTRSLHKCCCFAPCCDMLRTVDAIQECSVPIWFIHSNTDELIPKEHSQLLSSEAPASYGIWYLDQGESHSAFPTDSQLFLQKLQEFVTHCLTEQQDIAQPGHVNVNADPEEGSALGEHLKSQYGTSPDRAAEQMQPLMRQPTKRYQHGANV